MLLCSGEGAPSVARHTVACVSVASGEHEQQLQRTLLHTHVASETGMSAPPRRQTNKQEDRFIQTCTEVVLDFYCYINPDVK